MGLTFVRNFDLSGSADVDPTEAQPPSTALGPLVTAKRGSVLINLWEVSALGVPIVPTVGLNFDVAVMTWSSLPAAPAPGAGTGTIPADQTVPAATGAWGRGLVSAAQVNGVWQVQAELGDVVGFQVAILAKSLSPSTWLAIYADLDERGPQ
jgi:hypothetical protein